MEENLIRSRGYLGEEIRILRRVDGCVLHEVHAVVRVRICAHSKQHAAARQVVVE